MRTHIRFCSIPNTLSWSSSDTFGLVTKCKLKCQVMRKRAEKILNIHSVSFLCVCPSAFSFVSVQGKNYFLKTSPVGIS